MIDIFYILRGLVYAQSLLWIKLLDYDIDIRNKYIKGFYYFSLGTAYIYLRITGFSFNQYTNDLLCFYVILVIYSSLILHMFYSFYDVVCLSFLLVFINSYYWEFMLHFNAIIFYGLSFNQITQAFHLIPAYLLYRKLIITNKKFFKKELLFGLVISLLNLLELNIVPNYIWFYNDWIHLRRIVNKFTRFYCLNILLWVVLNYTVLRKKERDIKLPFQDNKLN